MTTAYLARRGVKTYHLAAGAKLTACDLELAGLIPAGQDRIVARRGLNPCRNGCAALAAEPAPEPPEVDPPPAGPVEIRVYAPTAASARRIALKAWPGRVATSAAAAQEEPSEALKARYGATAQEWLVTLAAGE